MREFPPLRLDTVNQCLWRGDGLAEERIVLAFKASPWGPLNEAQIGDYLRAGQAESPLPDGLANLVYRHPRDQYAGAPREWSRLIVERRVREGVARVFVPA